MRVALAACEPVPDKRFRDAAAMLARLEEELRGAGPAVRRRRQVLAVAAGLILLALAAIGLHLAAPGDRPENPPAQVDLPQQPVDVNFITSPFDATVLLDGQLVQAPDGTPATTPCTIEGLTARPYHVRFRHPERGEYDLGLVDFAATREVKVTW